MRAVVALVLLLTVTAARSQPLVLHDAGSDSAVETPHLEARPVAEVRLGADGRATLTVQVTPKPRMHIYARDAEGVVPFSLDFGARGDIRVGSQTYPAPELYIFPPTGESSSVYVKPFRVTLGFTVSGKLRDAIARATAPVPVPVTLRYQACDDRVCYRSEERTLMVLVKGKA